LMATSPSAKSPVVGTVEAVVDRFNLITVAIYQNVPPSNWLVHAGVPLLLYRKYPSVPAAVA